MIMSLFGLWASESRWRLLSPCWDKVGKNMDGDTQKDSLIIDSAPTQCFGANLGLELFITKSRTSRRRTSNSVSYPYSGNVKCMNCGQCHNAAYGGQSCFCDQACNSLVSAMKSYTVIGVSVPSPAMASIPVPHFVNSTDSQPRLFPVELDFISS